MSGAVAEWRSSAAIGSDSAASFRSILFPSSAAVEREQREPPAYFRDLHLDQVVAALIADRSEYDLAPFFHAPLQDLDSIAYRQEVMRDLERDGAMCAVTSFAERMRRARRLIAAIAKLSCEPAQQRWFLNGAQMYCEAVSKLSEDLNAVRSGVESRGLQALRRYLDDYRASTEFLSLVQDAERVEQALADVRYCILIKGDAVTVQRPEPDLDYVPLVESTFEKFRRAATRDYLARFSDTDLDTIATRVLERVALLFPNTFQGLARFRAEHADFFDPMIVAFDREVHFYIAYLALIAPLRRAGLPFCYPKVSRDSKGIVSRDSFDIALARKLVATGAPIVGNDFELRGPERLLVVSGPNQGGKTTFARTFGQLHHLACLGVLVPGSEARVRLFEGIFTHFEREEHVATLRGKLEDDLVRIHAILDAATPRSILILNELFSSTTLQDAIYLSRKIMATISSLDAFGVWVTFLDELASFDDKTVSMVAAVSHEDPSLRTFKVERRPADGLAYAVAIAEKYRVTGVWLERRIRAHVASSPRQERVVEGK